MVLVTVWAKTDSGPQTKHFTVYGCGKDNTQVSNVKAGYLKNKTGRIFIGLSGKYSQTKTSFVASSSSACTLPLDVLFLVLATDKPGDVVTITFRPFEEPELASGKGNLTEVDNATKHVRNSEKKTGNVTCDLSLLDKIKLQSSVYGFISCQGDDGASKMWREWRQEVRVLEEEAARMKTNIIIGVACGSGVGLLAILACVFCRVRSGPSPAYQSGRRPSNISARTASTT